MTSRALILIMTTAIILQNTCLMGAAGHSALFMVLNKSRHTQCRLGCPLKKTPVKDGLNSFKKAVKQDGGPVICHFQFRTEETGSAPKIPLAHEPYSFSRNEQFKSLFLDPPAKPPEALFSA